MQYAELGEPKVCAALSIGLFKKALDQSAGRVNPADGPLQSLTPSAQFSISEIAALTAVRPTAR
jgi:hypothetical protein